jgi:hypothetical protein
MGINEIGDMTTTVTVIVPLTAENYQTTMALYSQLVCLI